MSGVMPRSLDVDLLPIRRSDAGCGVLPRGGVVGKLFVRADPSPAGPLPQTTALDWPEEDLSTR